MEKKDALDLTLLTETNLFLSIDYWKSIVFQFIEQDHASHNKMSLSGQ